MRIPYGWVREFVDLKLSPQDAADRLVNAGTEVASVTPLAPVGLRGAMIGEIEAIERDLGESRGHHLVLCRVRACPSSVVKRSPSRARRTTMVASATVAASKACSGWPSSQRT